MARSVAARLAGSDPGTDIAVLRVEDSAHAAVPKAGGPPKPGQIALNLGRSPDSGVNATMGIVSAVSGAWRTWRGGRLDHYIRLDLTVYPGSSGGVVVNTAGEALGIATSALSRIAGLAIPTVSIDRVVDEILARGRVARGYLGVGLQRVELPDHQKGLIVLSLEPEGPAARAGSADRRHPGLAGRSAPWRRRTISRACSRRTPWAAASRPPWCAEGPRRR